MEQVKRGRGRPKGSTNKPKGTNVNNDNVKRGRGRPKGSTNATTDQKVTVWLVNGFYVWSAALTAEFFPGEHIGIMLESVAIRRYR